jgi:hypothetical protein
MNRNPPAHHQRLTLDRYLSEVLVRGGLAELIPLRQRGRFAPRLGLAVLFVSSLGWLGLPWVAIVSCLLLAFATESLGYYWWHRGSPFAAVVRRPLWVRIRPSFYWPLAGGVLLGTWLYAGEGLLDGLLRGGFQWLCFRALEDLIKHPERYGSVQQLGSWLRHLWHQGVHAFRAWVKYAIVGTLLAVVLNLSSGQIWESVGHTAWDRLLVFGGGLYLLALLTFQSLAKSTVKTAVGDAMERWDGIKPMDLKRTLRSVPAIPEVFYSGSRSAELVEEWLQWKNEDNLVARVGQRLTSTLTRRYRRNVWISSSMALVLVALLISVSVFLIVPRDVLTRSISTGSVGQPDLLLAVDDFAELGALGFWQRLLELDTAALASEPLPKLAFLEAVIIVSLIMFETALDQLRADLQPAELRRWLTIGTTYLAVLENGFQYLYSGFLTRKLAGVDSLHIVSIRNDVLLVPSAERRVSVFKAICGFLKVYEPLEWNGYPSAITILDSYPLAREWALRFLRFSPLLMDRPQDLKRASFWERDTDIERYWIWSGNRLMTLSSLEEARWYARLVTLYNHANGGKGHGPK